MRKLFLFIAALTLSAGMWAETINGVKYLDANGKEQTANNVTVITSNTFSVTLNKGWYVVNGDFHFSNGAICSGEVNLILADGAVLTANPNGKDDIVGIKVSVGASLTIYAQSTGEQMGQLIATGGSSCAGIGGGNGGSGSNITINGGIVTATGGSNGAGIGCGQSENCSNITINGGIVTATGGSNGAGIGGGNFGSGSNITINGGTVTATGGGGAAGIGGGQGRNSTKITINGGTVTANGGDGAACIGNGANAIGSNNIKVSTTLLVRAEGNNPPITMIDNDGDDLASSLVGKRYATVGPDLLAEPKANAIAAIDALVEGMTDTYILAVANKEKKNIKAAATEEAVNAIKEQTLADLAIIIKYYNSAAALGDMATPCTDCHAVEVTKGDKTITLYAPDKVKYIKAQ